MRRRSFGRLASARRSSGVGAARSTAAQRAIQVVLAEFGVQRRERLLPDERDAGIDQRQRAEPDQRAREHAQCTARERAAAGPPAGRSRRGPRGGERENGTPLPPIVAEPTRSHRATPARRRTAGRGS